MKILLTIVFSIISLNLYAQILTKSQEETLVGILRGKNFISSDPLRIVSVSKSGKTLNVTFTKTVETTLIDSAKIQQMRDSIRHWKNLRANFYIGLNGKNITTYAPKQHNFSGTTIPLVRREGNLAGRNIALWNSHGKYYSIDEERWKWQRARLFTTVEDLLTASFTVEFLAPMLENAGANVFLPRERDTQTNIYFADNDKPETFSSTRKATKKVPGFLPMDKLTGNENPFTKGTSAIFNLTESDSLTFKFENIKASNYNVYVTFTATEESSDSVVYRINGSQYIVNQQLAGDMFVYLGNHYFDGNAEINVLGSGKISADAIRLGGGMGIVERGEQTSGVPCFAEGARYYLQADGFPAKIYTLSNNTNDYNDDINCRGEWVNSLIHDKNIPIDLALAMHTDAGIATADSTIGTLTIIKTNLNIETNISRDWAYMIETQILNDLRQTWDSTWSARGIWDKNYSEARRANCPNVLIEMLSHQNLNDARLAQHPQFRFDFCRAIYKAITRFINGQDAVIQPLTPHNFALERLTTDSLRLSWSPTIDPLEEMADAEIFEIYCNNSLLGTTVDTFFVVHQPVDSQVYEYYLKARNDGGSSFESIRLSAILKPKSSTALFVSGYDRLAAPKAVKTSEFSGFLEIDDAGTPYHENHYRTGSQYDFTPFNPWSDDDSPGWGASFADEEFSVVYGSRNSTINEVKKIADEGYSVISQTKEYFETASDSITYERYDIYLGGQRTAWYGNMEPRHQIYTPEFMDRLTQIKSHAKQINISGYYVGSELKTKEQKQFASTVLGFEFLSDYASKTRIVIGKKIRFELPSETRFCNPDAITPANKKAKTILRYEDSGSSAAIKFENICVYGF